MFARLGLFLGFCWFVFIVVAGSNNGTISTDTFISVAVAPAAIIAFIGVALTWIFSGLFGE